MVSNNDITRSATSHLVSTFSDALLANNWAQVRAKHIRYAVALRSDGGPDYNYSVARLTRVATSALHTALLVLNDDPGKLGELSGPLGRAAELMEYLANLPGETGPFTTRVIASALYQLAGYEANSMCIARELPLNPLRNGEGTFHLREVLDRWTVLTLRRQLLRLRVETESLVRDRERLEQRWLRSADEEDSNERLIDLAVALLAAEMFGSLATAALQGLTTADEFHGASEELSGLLVDSGRALQLLETKTVQGIGALLLRNSVWNQIPELVRTEPAWERYATLSARGTGTYMLDATSRIELWESQRRALSEGLLTSPTGFVIRMPTSAGKTRIAELSIVHTLVSGDEKKAIYVAPFRSLADEVEASLTPILADLGLRVSTVLGGFEVDELEAQIVNFADLIVTTPEKLTLLTRTRPELLRDVGLVVLDEGHVIDDRDRGVGYELLLTKLRRHILADAKIMFVSAVISQENAGDFAEWLCRDRENFIDSTWRPARQLIGVYNAQRDRIDYPLDGPVAGAAAPFVIGAATPRNYIDYTPKLRRRRNVQFPKRTKGEIVAELAINFSKQGPVLVFTSSRGNTESVARTIQRGLQLRSQTDGAEVPPPFARVRNQPPQAAIEVASLWLGEDATVTSLLREGIGVNHAGLPDPVRKAIESDCRDGLLPVVVATTTLAQGVNLPVKTVVVHSITRYVGEDADGSGPLDHISARDLWNMIGRAGRAVQETEGHVVLAAIDDTQARECYQLLRSDIPPIKGQLFSMLQDLTDRRISDDRFRSILDSELITLMVEEAVGTSAEILFQDLIGSSFVRIQAERENIELRPLHTKGAETISAIRREVSSQAEREVFARTGFDVRTCLKLRDRITDRIDRAADVMFDENVPVGEIIEFLIPNIIDIPQMDTRYDFSGEVVELALDWLSQVPMPEIVQRHLPEGDDPRAFHRFMSDIFGFNLPWAIGGFTSIAKGVLGSDFEMSETIRWLPTMIRYGVGTPTASWAMTFGCPSREMSTALASGFVSDLASGSTNYGEFATWFSSLTEEDFTYRFEASPHQAEVLTRRSAALVPNNRQITTLLRTKATSFTSGVAGIRYGNRVRLLARVLPGAQVQLIRDYENQYDRNAIGVWVGSDQLGYVPRTEARLLAPPIDAGAFVFAEISEVDRNLSAPSVTMRMSIETNEVRPSNSSTNP